MGHSTGACWRRCSRAGASRRPRWRSTPGSSAAFCLCRPPCSGWWARSWSTRLRGAARITLTFDQFKYGWTDALDEDEAKRLYDSYHVAGRGSPWPRWPTPTSTPGPSRRSTRRTPIGGPLLILDGEKDHTVPWAIANGAYKRQKRNPSVTEIKKMPNRGHSLTIDHGWQEVAQTALDFIKRFVPAEPS